MKILLVEDQIELASNILSFLSSEQMDCDHAHNMQSAQTLLLSNIYDVILLDIMLPDGSGLDLFKTIKESQLSAGVIIISAKNALDDKIRGLDLGADDYLTKPFHLTELNARIKSIYRRRNDDHSTVIQFGDIQMDLDQRQVSIKGEVIEFTAKEQELLSYFIANKNRVLTKQNIAEYLWGNNLDFLDSFDFVYQHIKNIRRKINSADGPDCIKTIYGLGYKMTI